VADLTSRHSIRGFEDLGIDQLVGFVREIRSHPAWAGGDSGFVDTTNHLTVMLRQGRLIAVHADEVLVDRLQRWLDKAPRPAARRIPPDVLETALLQGESKGLWLRGTHQRRTTKPDTKNISGERLQDALSPFEDSSYAMGSAKALLDDDPERVALRGTIGTTPRRSSVWFKAAADFMTFAPAVTELLKLLDKQLAAGQSTGHGLPHLARAVGDLSEVFGAYEVTTTAPDDLPSVPGTGDELLEAAATLQGAVLDVRGKPDSADLVLDVGFGGSASGSLVVGPRLADHGFELSLGFAGEPRNPPIARGILDALQHTELITIYYRSGHTFTDGRIWKDQVPVAAFGNWAFENFTGFDISREKPNVPRKAPGAVRKKTDVSEQQEIHNRIGKSGDISLFAWVASRFRDGWLTCDDGPGEAADFFHIGPDGTLSAIHVKAAEGASPQRRVAAAAYEVVVGQAVKNLIFADVDRLRTKLGRAPVDEPACWTDGTRTADRTDFLDALNMRSATDARRVVIVQPHISELTYQRLRKASAAANVDLLRLHLVENMLNSARASAIGIGAELTVIGSLT
jgi:hypothetical protein